MTIQTQEQYRRTLQALTETCDLLDRELAYLPHLQKQDRIEFYRAHSEKLAAMINEYRSAA